MRLAILLMSGLLASATLAAEPANRFTPADYDRHIAELRKTLPAGFSIVIQEPFVVVGDEPTAVVKQRSLSTVKFAVDRLKRQYFDKDPDDILTVWLFKDKDSYERYTREIFKDTPGTPFGYYSPHHRALIMNIATGGGTLVHEIVHPFMHANFAACPPWFNEGMGSLYEQCGDRAGQITGHTNWRLAGLQKAIPKKQLPSFKDFMAMDTAAFYSEDRGTNYAQARYLCYYLQERGLLGKYYRQFVAGQKDDPTGHKTLQQLLGLKEAEMARFQLEWEAFVMKLTFP